MTGPLDGIRVLEFSQIVAAPVCGVNLADLGADVIKVEPIGGEQQRHVGAVVPREGKTYQALNRGKRGLIIDLRNPRGLEVIHRAVQSADVVLVNYRLGVSERLGIDYPTLRSIKPDLIYWQNTGFGENGPERTRAGSDVVAQAYSGLMVADGKIDSRGAPGMITLPFADIASGFVGAMGICAALFRRAMTGKGDYLSTSLLRTSLFMQYPSIMREPISDASTRDPLVAAVEEAQARGAPYREVLEVRRGVHSQRAAFRLYYGSYETKDGSIVLGALTKANRDGARRVLGLEGDDSDAPDFDVTSPENLRRIEHWEQVIIERMKTRTIDEWLADFDAAGVPASRVNFPEMMSDDPQVIADGIMWDLEHAVTGMQSVVGPALLMEQGLTEQRRPAPAYGQHTLEVLEEIGYDASERQALVDGGVVVAG